MSWFFDARRSDYIGPPLVYLPRKEMKWIERLRQMWSGGSPPRNEPQPTLGVAHHPHDRSSPPEPDRCGAPAGPRMPAELPAHADERATRGIASLRCSTSVSATPGAWAERVFLQGSRTMDEKGRWGGYFWPATTMLLVVPPLYNFRDEESILHILFRVAWSVLVILSLVELGRHLYRDLRGRRVSEAGPGRTPPARG